MVAYLVFRRRGLLAGAGIRPAVIDTQPVEDRVGLGLLVVVLLEDLPVKLLPEKQKGAAREDVAAGEIFPGHASGQKRNNVLLRQRRLTAESRLRVERRAVDVNMDRVILDQ